MDIGTLEDAWASQNRVRKGIAGTDITFGRISGFTEKVHAANKQIANSFRVHVGKKQKDFL